MVPFAPRCIERCVFHVVWSAVWRLRVADFHASPFLKFPNMSATDRSLIPARRLSFLGWCSKLERRWRCGRLDLLGPTMDSDGGF